MTVNAGTKYPVSARCTSMVKKAGPARYSRLVGNGWTFAESYDVGSASAVTNPYQKQIIFAPRVAARQSNRDINYVTQHEVGHALDFDAGSPYQHLAQYLGLNFPSAQECLAEACAYWARADSALEKTWILSSIAWHMKASIRWRYSWSNVRAVQTRELADMLVRGPGVKNGTYFHWVGSKVLPGRALP